MRRWNSIVASLVIAVVATVHGATLEIALAAWPTDLDPHLVEDFAAEPVLGRVCEGLREFNA